MYAIDEQYKYLVKFVPQICLNFVYCMLYLMQTASRAEDDSPETLGSLVDEEMASTSQAIEAAALRIQEMLKKSREDDTGVKLEVNERILDSCTELMKAIKVLIIRSKELQSEIVKEGMVSLCMIY